MDANISLHEFLMGAGFTGTITAVKKTDKKELLRILGFYNEKGYKIVVVEGSEIGIYPPYLPKPLSGHYVFYVKCTGEQAAEKISGQRVEIPGSRDRQGIERDVGDDVPWHNLEGS